MSNKLLSEDREQKRDSQTEKKFGGVQLQGFNTDTITRMSRAHRNVLKVAIHAPGADPQLYEINQKKSLKENIKDFCERWEISNPEFYAFRFIDTYQYITESNRREVKDGSELQLTTAPNKVAESLLLTLKKPRTAEDQLFALKKLSQYSSDLAFSGEFILNDGLKLLVGMVEYGECVGENLAYALTALLEFMDHGTVEWDSVLTIHFIKAIARCVNRNVGVDATVLQRALGIIECAVVNSQSFFNEIVDAIDVGNLVSHLQRSNSEIQQSAIALLNSLFLRTPIEKGRVVGRRKISDTLLKKQFRTVILNNVIRTSKVIGSEMAHQLHILQVLTLNVLEDRMLQKLDPSCQEDREKLFELRNIAFESTTPQGMKRQQGHVAFNPMDFKKLGFVNYNNPVLDFDHTPPGVLSLDLMVYFARNHSNNYIKLVLENTPRNDKHECPFGRSSIEVAQKLCEILKIGEQPTELGQDYHPMLFTHDHAFEEFFCICVQVFNKTWKEMSAIKDDFDKVMNVFHDQLIMALAKKSSSFESFRHALSDFPYSAILKKRLQERLDKEQFDSQAPPVVELQHEIRPEIVELIKQQRFNFMENGTAFHKIASKRRDKSRWFCRLSPNHKVLVYGDIDDQEELDVGSEMLFQQLVIANIKELVVGKNCPHIKHARAHKTTADLAFSIIYDPDESLNFIAPNRMAWCMWTDGIHALLGKKFVSERAKSDLEMLLSMEMKLRLLDLENIPIPDQAPEIPPPPKDYNFVSSDP